MTIVEKSADPAASPSSPSIKLTAFVMSKTQNTVRGKPRALRRASELEIKSKC